MMSEVRLPVGWEEKKLEGVCEIINGGTPKTSIKEYWDGDILWITPKDLGKLTTKYVDETPRQITELGLKKSSAKIIPQNSLILSTRAPIGHLAINKKEMATNQGCRGIIPHKNIDSLFLFYFLSKSIALLNTLGAGATFKELSTYSLGSVEVPIPSLHEQKRIVAILDEAFYLSTYPDVIKNSMQPIVHYLTYGWKERRNPLWRRPRNGSSAT